MVARCIMDAVATRFAHFQTIAIASRFARFKTDAIASRFARFETDAIASRFARFQTDAIASRFAQGLSLSAYICPRPVTIGVYLCKACHYRRIFVHCLSLLAYICPLPVTIGHHQGLKGSQKSYLWATLTSSYPKVVPQCSHSPTMFPCMQIL